MPLRPLVKELLELSFTETAKDDVRLISLQDTNTGLQDLKATSQIQNSYDIVTNLGKEVYCKWTNDSLVTHPTWRL